MERGVCLYLSCGVRQVAVGNDVFALPRIVAALQMPRPGVVIDAIPIRRDT
jgi:hypothetical protein